MSNAANDVDLAAADRVAALREASRTAARLWCYLNPDRADDAARRLNADGEVPTQELTPYLGLAETELNHVLRERSHAGPARHYWPHDDFA